MGKVKSIGVRLALAALGWVALALVLPVLLGFGFQSLFAAWNVNDITVSLAPGPARFIYAWHGSFITLITDWLLILLCEVGFKTVIHKPQPKTVGIGWLAGTGLAIVSAALFLLTDSLRLNWQLSRPHLTPGLLALFALELLSALAEELFTKGVIYETLKERWGKLWATVGGTLAFFLIGGGLLGSVIAGVNVALMGLVCCLLYEKGGLWLPTAFRWGWGFATVFLLGQGGGDRAVYRLYAVSERLLTGGDDGFTYGLWLTLVLIAFIVSQFARHFKTKA